MSVAFYWGLPTHGIVLKRCRTCREPVLVRCSLRPTMVMLFNEDKTVHEHQASSMWVWKWVEYVTKQRAAASTRTYATDLRGKRHGMTLKDRGRVRSPRVLGYDNVMRSSPFVEMDDTGE